MSQLKAFEFFFEKNKTVYLAGDVVKGKCILQLCGPMKMKNIKLSMRGVAKVKWIEERTSYNNVLDTNTYTSEHVYFVTEQTVLKPENTATQQIVLEEGNYEWEFAFLLPAEGLSRSFEGEFGSVRYFLKGKIEKKSFSSQHRTEKAFTVITHININRAEFLLPVENSAEKHLSFWCFRDGIISLVARTDKRGYCVGESILITAQFENHSRTTVFPRASLHSRHTFVTPVKNRTTRKKLTEANGLDIPPGSAVKWEGHPFRIPLTVLPSLANCPIIVVDYFVRITLVVRRGLNLKIDLPVVIGAAN